MFIQSSLKSSPCFTHIWLIAVGTWNLVDVTRGAKWIPLILGMHQQFPESGVGAHDSSYVMSAKKARGFLSNAFNIRDMDI